MSKKTGLYSQWVGATAYLFRDETVPQGMSRIPMARRKRNKPSGFAFFVKALKSGFYPGSALYKVEPPITWNDNGFLTSTAWVIVAVSPQASDHGRPETTCFAARPNGRMWFLKNEVALVRGKWRTIKRNDYGSSEIDGCRVVGRQDPAAALLGLEHGYELVQGPVNQVLPQDEPETWSMAQKALEREAKLLHGTTWELAL